VITPIEIRRASFSKSFRGYSIEEVDNFLSMLAVEWDSMLQENQSLKLELEKAKSALNSYQELEGMMHKTLKQAEETSKSTLENAKKDAELVIANAEQKAQSLIQNSQSKIEELEKEIRELSFRKKDILAQLKLFLTAQLEKIESFEIKESELPQPEEKIIIKEKDKTISFFEHLYKKIQPNPMVQKIVSDL
jgi:cell division initiation protein